MHSTFSYKILLHSNKAYPEDDSDWDDLVTRLLLQLLVHVGPGLVSLEGLIRVVLHLPEEELILADLHNQDHRVEKDRDRRYHRAVVPAALSEHFIIYKLSISR